MEDREKLKDWVREKLDDGYSKARLKEVMDDRGLDTSAVDEVSGDDPDFKGFGEPDEASQNSGNVQGDTGDDSTSPVESVPVRWLGAGLVVVIAIVAVAVGTDTGFDGGTGNGEAEVPRGCSDVGDIGVRLEDVSKSVVFTTATVKVVRGSTWMSLEVYSNGDLKSSSRKYVEGSAEMTVGAVGDRVVIHPVNCELYRDSARY